MSTIFVNRLQFAPHEDFDTYPRTLEADCAQLEAAGCDIVFAPSEARVVPPAPNLQGAPAHRAVPTSWKATSAPAFFIGVCTVVMKLLACTQARTALVWQKGLPAAHGDSQHGETVRACPLTWWVVKPSATKPAWPCPAAMVT